MNNTNKIADLIQKVNVNIKQKFKLLERTKFKTLKNNGLEDIMKCVCIIILLKETIFFCIITRVQDETKGNYIKMNESKENYTSIQ